MPLISKPAVDVVVAILSDPQTGFNRNLALIADTYGIKPYTVDWSQKSANFIDCDLNPDSLEQSANITYPYTTVDTLEVADDSRVIAAVFAGTILVSIKVHISTTNEQTPRSISPLTRAIEDAMFQTLNLEATLGAYLTAGFTINGRWRCQKSPTVFGAQNWRRSIMFSNAFGRITN